MEKQTLNVKTNSRGAKKHPKTARSLRGNSLVPVVIALAISAVATVAFLQQGETLMDDNKRILATTEVARIVSNIQTLIAVGKAANEIKSADIGHDPTNVFGLTVSFVDDSKKLEYDTGSPSVCALLLGTFSKSKNRDSDSNDTTCDPNGKLSLLFKE